MKQQRNTPNNKKHETQQNNGDETKHKTHTRNKRRNKNNNDSSKLSNEFFDILENHLDPELYTSHNGDETMQT